MGSQELNTESGVHQASVSTFSAASRPALIVYIPSGGGKSTLAKQFPELYIDCDDIVDHRLLPRMTPEIAAEYTSADWAHRNLLIRRLAERTTTSVAGKIILFWHPDTVPLSWRLGTPEVVALPSQLTGLRMNEMNIASLRNLRGKRRIRYSFETLHLQILAIYDTVRDSGDNDFLNVRHDAHLLFSTAFNSRFSSVVSACTTLAQTKTIVPAAFDVVRREYDNIFLAYKLGEITTLDLDMFHECAFAGQKPDLFYDVVDRRDPLYLDSNRVVQDAVERGMNKGLLHGLHVWSNELILRMKNARRADRLDRYMTQTQLRVHSAERAFVVIAPAWAIIEVFGHSLPIYGGQSEGLYMASDVEQIPNRAVPVQIHFQVMYDALKDLTDKRSAKHLAQAVASVRRVPGLVTLRNTTATRNRPSPLPSVRAAHKLKLALKGTAAFAYGFDVADTPARIQRKQRAELSHADDAGIIEKHLNSFETQTAILDLIDHLLLCLENNDEVDGVHALETLYPYADEGLLSRTRMRWTETWVLLNQHYTTFGSDRTASLVCGTGGMGLQAFSSLLLAATVSGGLHTVVHALVDAGLASYGLKHWIDTCKELHIVARRIGRPPDPVREMLSGGSAVVGKLGAGDDLTWFTDRSLLTTSDAIDSPSFGESAVVGAPGDVVGTSVSLTGVCLACGCTPAWGAGAGGCVKAGRSEPCTNCGGKDWNPGVEATLIAGRNNARVPIQQDDCMYLHMLSGRFYDDTLANEGYVAKRSKEPKPHPMHTASDDVLQASRLWSSLVDRAMSTLSDAISDALGAVADQTPEQFLAQYISLAPSGSVGHDKRGLEWLDDKHNATKRLWMSGLTKDKLLALMDDEEMLLTYALTKTEVSKLRALIPGPIVHWALETVCVSTLEGAIYRSDQQFMLETNAWLGMVANEVRRKRVRDGKITLDSDYADFNYLHTIQDMQKFWRMIAMSAQPFVADGDWNGTNYAGFVVRCAGWLERALDRMYVVEPHSDGRAYRVTRGLWSGWRTTSAINNTMNWVYARALRQAIQSELGNDPLVSYMLNGDDGDAEATSLVDGLVYLREMFHSELDIQPSKQLLGNSQAEFLRVMFRAGKLKGSLARAVGSFVCSDMQAPVVDRGPEFARGTSSALNGLIRRGADEIAVEKLRTPLLMELVRLSYDDQLGDHHTQHLTNWQALYVPEADGGIGCARYSAYPRTRLRGGQRKPWVTPKIDWMLPGAPDAAERYLVHHVTGRLNAIGIDPSVSRMIYRDATNITRQGVDTVLNRRSTNYVRELAAEHIEWLNHAPVEVAPPLYIPSEMQRLVDNTIVSILEEDPAHLAKHIYIDIEEAIDTLVARALGVMGISRSILTLMRRKTTGELLHPRDVIEELSEKPADFVALRTLLPDSVVDTMLTGRFNIPRDVGGYLPASYNPLLVSCQNAVLKFYPPPDVSGLSKQDYIMDMMRATNYCFLRKMRKTYDGVFCD
ncbi:RNA-dependent RNA polymerase [Rhizoctonia solani dsRNA virus 10]|uniref:RNA-directed RNA polymerase n=1 Tax=Rhizoctonia solani dsRNA virus 10 TaxID=2600095 RepID=A0A5B8H9Z6_9VIRU|nr:RNA-dependent RNA polymerase [Rhizoctonia solani dsRNA virus 10]